MNRACGVSHRVTKPKVMTFPVPCRCTDTKAESNDRKQSVISDRDRLIQKQRLDKQNAADRLIDQNQIMVETNFLMVF